jgi:hypothetical protein
MLATVGRKPRLDGELAAVGIPAGSAVAGNPLLRLGPAAGVAAEAGDLRGGVDRAPVGRPVGRSSEEEPFPSRRLLGPCKVADELPRLSEGGLRDRRGSRLRR